MFFDEVWSIVDFNGEHKSGISVFRAIGIATLWHMGVSISCSLHCRSQGSTEQLLMVPAAINRFDSQARKHLLLTMPTISRSATQAPTVACAHFASKVRIPARKTTIPSMKTRLTRMRLFFQILRRDILIHPFPHKTQLPHRTGHNYWTRPDKICSCRNSIILSEPSCPFGNILA